jgi:hypothetical protein
MLESPPVACLPFCRESRREHFYLYLKEMEPRFNDRKVAALAASIKETVKKRQAVPD